MNTDPHAPRPHHEHTTSPRPHPSETGSLGVHWRRGGRGFRFPSWIREKESVHESLHEPRVGRHHSWPSAAAIASSSGRSSRACSATPRCSTRPNMTVVLCGTGSPLRRSAARRRLHGGDRRRRAGDGRRRAGLVGDARPDQGADQQAERGAAHALPLRPHRRSRRGDDAELDRRPRRSRSTCTDRSARSRSSTASSPAYAQDADYRTLHHDEQHMPRAAAPAVGARGRRSPTRPTPTPSCSTATG